MDTLDAPDANRRPPAGAAPPVATGPAPDAGGTVAPDAPRPRGIWGVLRRRNFALLFSGQLISVLGDQVYGLALPWTVLAVTGDPRQMAVVLVAESVPRVLLLMVGGALADRLNPRVVMLVADAGRAAVVGALGATLFVSLPPLWIVAALAALQGAGSGLFGPGVQALLPRILPAEDLPAANGLVMVIQYSTLAVGPVVGGIATAAQATLAFLADAASFVVSALSLGAIRLPAPASPLPAAPTDSSLSAGSSGSPLPAGEGPGVRSAPARGGLLGEIGGGLRYAVRQPLIRATMIITVLANMGLTGVANVSLIVLSRALSPSAVTLGILLAAFGVGGVVGGLSAGLFARLPRRGVAAMALYGVTVLAMAGVPVAAGTRAGRLPVGLDLSASQLPFALPPGFDLHVAGVALLLGIVGLFIGLGDTMFLTIMQQRIAPEYLARVFSVQFTASAIAGPASLLIAGYLTAAYGPGLPFEAGSALFLVAVLIGFASREVRHL